MEKEETYDIEEINENQSGDDNEEYLIRDSEITEKEDIESQNVNNIAITPISKAALAERHALEFSMIVIGGALLAFNAGFVNGITYLAAGMPVSHITGTTTKAGLFLAREDSDNFGILIAVIICFIFGSTITGTFISHDSFHLGRQYGPLFLIGSLMFLASCLVAHFDPSSDIYFYFAAIACGLQNSLTTRYSGSVIRTTHLTGAGTDIGLVLGRCLTGDYKESWKLKVLVPIFLAFLFGGYMAVHFYGFMGRLALMLNVIFFFSIGALYSVIVGKELHISFWRAFFGTYERMEKDIKASKSRANFAIKKIVRKLRRKKSIHDGHLYTNSNLRRNYSKDEHLLHRHEAKHKKEKKSKYNLSNTEEREPKL